MLLAKIALGFCGTIVLAAVYTFHQGVMTVSEYHRDGKHVHVWIPAAIVPMAMHFVPAKYIEHGVSHAGPWLPTVRALAKGLEKYPEADLVDVQDGEQHVHVQTRGGRLLIDVNSPEEQVHVACPLATIEDVSEQVEVSAPAA